MTRRRDPDPDLTRRTAAVYAAIKGIRPAQAIGILVFVLAEQLRRAAVADRVDVFALVEATGHRVRRAVERAGRA
jgi:hypothetical protein